MGADFHARLHDMLRAFGASGSHWDAALLYCGDRFLLARPMPSSSPMACIAHVRGFGSHSCFARPYHAARGLGSQELRQRAVVASSVLDAPSRHGCRRRHPRSEGRVGELQRTATDCAPPPLERHRGAARVPPPESAGGRAGAGLISAADAMSDSMGKAVCKAAEDGDEAELRRLIERGGCVNWRNPAVRRRMCLAWAPASSSPLLLRSPSPPRQRPPCAVSPQPRRCWPFAAAPPPRRAWHTRVLVAWRAPHPRVLAHSPRVFWHSMTPRVLHLPRAEAQL
jgi:hypothetical protein